jgi:thiamine transport system substrate-binding protein
VVYAYDSWVADWGAGPIVAKLFKEKSGIAVRFVSKGDGGQLLSSLIAEKGKPGADAAIGIDNILAPRAIRAKVFAPYRPAGLPSLPADMVLDPAGALTPFDYGHFAIIWDSAKLAKPPASLEDLAKPAYAKKLILMDPRTSTPGLGFLAWTEAVYGPAWKDYWKRLRPSVLAMTPGWDSGYGLFVKGEAPLVLSYATSPAYHKENDKTDRYKALEFAEGHVMQVEGVGVVLGAAHRKNAEKFIDFLVSPECQKVLPLTQWMLPVDGRAELPASFSAALKPSRTLRVDAARVSADAVEAAETLAQAK